MIRVPNIKNSLLKKNPIKIRIIIHDLLKGRIILIFNQQHQNMIT